MLKKSFNRHSSCGSLLLEYSVLIAIVAASLLGMQIYIKRSISGRLRSASDMVGPQYGPKQATTTVTTTSANAMTVRTEPALQFHINPKTGDLELIRVLTTTSTIEKSETNRSGTETVDALDDKLWE